MELLIFGISLLTGWVVIFLAALVVMRFAKFFAKIWSSLVVIWSSGALILSSYLFICWIAGNGSAMWAKIAAGVLAIPLVLLFSVWGMFRIWVTGYSAFEFFDEVFFLGRKKTKDEESEAEETDSRKGFFSRGAFTASARRAHKNSKRRDGDSPSWSSYSFGTSGWESGMNQNEKSRADSGPFEDSSEYAEANSQRNEEAHGGGQQSLPLPIDALKAAQAYAVLGIEPGASDEEARSAYLQLMKFCHPDMTRNLPEKQQQTAIAWAQRINDAWDTVRGIRGI